MSYRNRPIHLHKNTSWNLKKHICIEQLKTKQAETCINQKPLYFWHISASYTFCYR